LRPDQKDTDSLPDYDVLDRILQGYIELRKRSRLPIVLHHFPMGATYDGTARPLVAESCR